MTKVGGAVTDSRLLIRGFNRHYVLFQYKLVRHPFVIVFGFILGKEEFLSLTFDFILARPSDLAFVPTLPVTGEEVLVGFVGTFMAAVRSDPLDLL